MTLSASTCGPPPTPPPPRPFVRPAAVIQTAAPATHSSDGQTSTRPRRTAPLAPDVQAARDCPPDANHALARYRIGGRPFHLSPVCTPDYSGEWAAVFATGTEQEASDVWVAVRSSRGLELHRVQRSPVGVRYTGATIVHGIVHLTGQSIATDEMPAGADVLVTFPIPWPGAGDPSALDLSPTEVPLLGARDRQELEHRIASIYVVPESSPEASETATRRIVQTGPRGLIAALPSGGGVPVVRAWQTGVYERVTILHPELDPASARVLDAYQVVQSLGASLDCSPGDRCQTQAAHNAVESSEVAVPAQILFRREGLTTVVSAIVQPARRPDPPFETTEQRPQVRLSPPVYNAVQDRALLESLLLEGSLQGRVTAVTRDTVRIVAGSVAAPDGRSNTVVYVLSPGRAPRRFEDRMLDRLATGPRELHFRDVERDAEPELVTIASLGEGERIVGVGTLSWPPSILDRTIRIRLDLMRLALGARSMAEADRAFRAWHPVDINRDTLCPAIERITSLSPRRLASAVPTGLTLIEYQEPGQPLWGRFRRIDARTIRTLSSGEQILGPFVGARCDAMVCDWAQGYCRAGTGETEQGYLWLTDSRANPIWGVSRRVSH